MYTHSYNDRVEALEVEKRKLQLDLQEAELIAKANSEQAEYWRKKFLYQLQQYNMLKVKVDDIEYWGGKIITGCFE